jgi:integrase
MKITELFEGFISDCKYDDLATSTINEHATMFKNILIPAIGNIEMENLIPIHRNLILKQASQYGKSASRHCILTFRRVLKYAKKCRIPIGVQPDEIEIPVYRILKEIRAWSRNEIIEIRKILNTDHSKEFSKHTPKRQIKAHQFVIERTKCLFEVMLHSGLRLSEALSIDKGRINWEAMELLVEDCKEKGKWKKVYLHGALDSIRDFLNYRTDNSSALFVTEKGKRLSYATAQSTLKRLKKRGKENPELMDTLNHRICRKTFITIPLQEGVDPKMVQNLAHHSSLHTTLNYYYQVEKEKVKPIHHQIFSTI